jgi:hypothetical protein
MPTWTPRKCAIYIAYATLGVILLMTATSLVTGVTQEAHEHFASPEPYAAGLLANAGALRLLFAFDLVFTILYAVYFTALAAHMRARGSHAVLVWLALGAMLATAALDLLEDQHILALMDGAIHGTAPSVDAITWQVTESGVKFSVSFVALFAFGVALPRTGKLSWVLAAFLTIGTLINTVVAYALPVTSPMAIELGRWAGFAVGFVLAISWLRREPD